jgi:predicted alpha/beta hydrolase family esterase
VVSTTLIVPGLNGSGPDHWQSWWQALDQKAIRVVQQDWATPDLMQWSAQVADQLQKATAPIWIVAHSFGCLAAVVAATRNPDAVAGAFLVAPADPQKFDVEPLIPANALPFPSLLVASSNDPWLRLMTAALWAQHWGSRLINIGAAGHINVDSGFGPWVEGRMLFTTFVRSQLDWPYGDIDGEMHRPDTKRDKPQFV